ncbi:MAG TPA: hypothetical protein VH092_01690 [Urbifossiella sp.]|jgi:hypothetical protein|nr:hypothetical protein [Urbifossiella sp.]
MKLTVRIGSLIVLLAVAGCGSSKPPRAPVTGKVTVAGKAPLTGGAIRFEWVGDPTEVGSGIIDPTGAYEVSDAPVGECKVIIENAYLQAGAGGGGGIMEKGIPQAAKQKVPPMKSTAPPKDADMPPEMATQSKGAPKYMRIDSSYSAAGTTPLKATVARGTNSFDFDVK